MQSVVFTLIAQHGPETVAGPSRITTLARPRPTEVFNKIPSDSTAPGMDVTKHWAFETRSHCVGLTSLGSPILLPPLSQD